MEIFNMKYSFEKANEANSVHEQMFFNVLIKI